MTGLDGSDDSELLVLRELAGRDHLVVLNAEAEVARLVILLGAALSLSESVERHLHGAVSNSVKADLEAGQRALDGHTIQFALLVLRQAGVAGIVGIGCQQRGRARTQRTIHEAFQ